MAAKFSDLITYFETLARQHKSIAHTDTEKHFFRMELDEVLGGIKRTDVNYKLLILEGYSFGFTDNRSDNVQKNREPAFMLIDHLSDKSDFDRMHEIWDELEEIGTDIIVRMKNDKRNASVPVIRGFNFESVRAQLIMNQLGNDIGMRFEFSMSSPVNTDVDVTRWDFTK
jgi:hypothetical protein